MASASGDPQQAAPATGEPAPAAQRSAPTPFLTKTYELVDDPAVDDIISWGGDGSTFVVWRPAEFARDLLPKYFKHNNFSSFVRQLNTYGFRKVVPDRWEFANDCFRRGDRRLLCVIHRRKVAPSPPVTVPSSAPLPVAMPANWPLSPANSTDEQVLSSNSSAGPPEEQPPGLASAGASGGGDLTEENSRLRSENKRLTRELGQVKKLCDNIVGLMSYYAAGLQVDGAESGEAPAVLDLIPAATAEAEETVSPRLFGVSLGLKRQREDVGEDDQGPSVNRQEVKVEQADP